MKPSTKAALAAIAFFVLTGLLCFTLDAVDFCNYAVTQAFMVMTMLASAAGTGATTAHAIAAAMKDEL